MHCTVVWPALLLTGLAFAASAEDVNKTVAAGFASATAKAILTAEAANGKEAAAAATIWIQVGSQYGSAVVSLSTHTTPHLRTIEGITSANAVHGLTHHKTVDFASCDASFDFTKTASTTVPTGTASGSVTTGTYRFEDATGNALATQSGLANSTVNMTVFNATTFNTTNFNTTTSNTTTSNTTTSSTTTSNTTISNTSTLNATSNPPFRGPFPTQLPTGISLFSSRAVSTQNSAGRLLVAVLFQVAFALL